MKSDPTELARIGEHKRAFALKQDQMIMFARSIIRLFKVDLPCHSEVNVEPSVAREFEEHPFAARMRTEQRCADQPLAKLVNVAAAEDAISRM